MQPQYPSAHPQYQGAPTSAVMNTVQANQPQVMSPGGLVTQAPPNYMSQSINNLNSGGGAVSPGYASPQGSGTNPNAAQWQTNYGPIDTGVGAFQQFTDSAYDQAMRQMQPQMEQQQRAIQQQLVSRGLQPGTAAYNAEMDRMGRVENDMLQSAAYGAQQQGLGAQNQFFNQSMQNNQFGLGQAQQNYGMQYGYDQLSNDRDIAGINAGARTAAAGISANAQNYGANLRHNLGLAQLTEDGRQFNSTDAYRNQQLDANTMLGMGNLFNQFNQTNTNNWLAQQGANQNWFNNSQSQIGMSPGSQFTPVGGTAQNMMGLGQAQANANAGMWGNIASGVGAFFSDVTMKENIKYDRTDNGIDLFTFNYKGSKTKYRGPIAQLVKETHPMAVFKRFGKLVVDFSKLPVDMELVHA
mgnify:CR=1 FL=1